MKQLKCYIIIGIFFTLIIGTLSHFLYHWTNKNFVIGLFTPVNESVWEHMKLIFFPMLIYYMIIFFKLKESYPCITSSYCFGILIGTFLIPIFFYTYTYILGKNIFILDLATFVLSTIIAFWIVYKLILSCKLQSYTFLLCCLVGILLLCFFLFTYYPPDIFIFIDPTMESSYY